MAPMIDRIIKKRAAITIEMKTPSPIPMEGWVILTLSIYNMGKYSTANAMAIKLAPMRVVSTLTFSF